MLTIFAVNKLKEFAKFFAGLREDSGMTQIELAAKAGVSHSYIQKLEAGNISPNPRFAQLRAVATVLGHDAKQWRAEYFGERHTGADPEDTMNNVTESSATVPVRPLPVYRFTPASRLGGPEDFYGSDFADSLNDDKQETMEAPAPSKKCIIVVLEGDCMEPKYRHGEKVVIDFDAVERAPGMVPGACYFIQTRGEEGGRNTFKEYAGENKEGEFLFRCINPKYKATLKLRPPFNAGIAVARLG